MVEGLFRLAGMVGDTALRVWDLNTGKCERRLQGHEAGALYGVAVTEDGQRALSDSFLVLQRYPRLGACPRKKLLKNKALELRSEGIKISHFLETRVLARGQDFFAFLKNS